MSDQMSRRGFMGAAATGAVALAGVALAGCSNTSASSEKSSEKEKAAKPVILVTSFGTSYNDSRHITIGAIEDAIREKYWQDYDIRRAFTAQIITPRMLLPLIPRSTLRRLLGPLSRLIKPMCARQATVFAYLRRHSIRRSTLSRSRAVVRSSYCRAFLCRMGDNPLT